MLSREQLLHLFDRFSFLTSQPGTFSSLLFSRVLSLFFFFLVNFSSISLFGFAEVKKRIADGVEDKQVSESPLCYELVNRVL